MTQSPFKFCCSEKSYVMDFFKSSEPEPWLQTDLLDANLWVAVVAISFCPVFWNLIARWEYNTKKLSSAFNSGEKACIVFGLLNIVLMVFRDWRFKMAVEEQGRWSLLQENEVLVAGYCCTTLGLLLTFASAYSLGFYGTFMGEYFGVPKRESAGLFPNNLMSKPMYLGSTLVFLGSSLIHASQAGLCLSAVAAVCYVIASWCERSFAAYIEEDMDHETAVHMKKEE